MTEDARPELTPMERAALAMGRLANERPLGKRLQNAFLHQVSFRWVRPAMGRRVFADGLETLLELHPDRGVLLCSNHRSFFDMYLTMLAVFDRGCPWLERIYFPVRANFFYERALGVLVNFAVGGGAMYPPIFRDRAKSAWNDDALERVSSFLADPHTIVGMHPEGTRNKGDDPYSLLPAQPGVGQIVLTARPIVVPMFINGVGNSFVGEIRDTRTRPASRWERPVIIVVGEPVDYGEFLSKKPRLALYKRAADRINDEILHLSERERELRARISARELDGDPRWLIAANGA